MNTIMNANADIRNFFENKMCYDVFDLMMTEHLSPFKFSEGKRFTLTFTFIDGEGKECRGESDFEIMEVDDNNLRVWVNIEEDEFELFDNGEEDDGVWLDYYTDLNKDYYINFDGTGYQGEWKEDKKITLDNYKIEAKNTW